MKIRASRLGLAVACGASLGDGLNVETSDTEPARMGHADHEAMADHIVGRPVDIPAIAKKWRVDDKELGKLFWSNVRMWAAIKDKFTTPSVELSLSYPGEVELTGHVDVMDATGAWCLQVGDHKTGRQDKDHDDQIRGYCWLGLQEYPRFQTVTGYTLLVREQVIDKHTYTRDELAEWWKHFSLNIKGRLEVFSPGEHCLNCPKSMTCPAVRESIRKAVVTLGEWDGEMPMPAAIVAKTYDAVKLLEKTCEQARDALRLTVQQAGGRYPFGDGRQLQIENREIRKLIPLKAFPILAKEFGQEAVLECCTLGKGKVEELAKEHAPMRGKGKAAKQLIDDLEQVGAVEIETQDRLEVKRDPAFIGSKTGVGVGILGPKLAVSTSNRADG